MTEMAIISKAGRQQRPLDRRFAASRHWRGLVRCPVLADLLLAMGRPGDALKEFEASLGNPLNRFNSLIGAGRAAELSGDREKAGRFIHIS